MSIRMDLRQWAKSREPSRTRGARENEIDRNKRGATAIQVGRRRRPGGRAAAAGLARLPPARGDGRGGGRRPPRAPPVEVMATWRVRLTEVTAAE